MVSNVLIDSFIWKLVQFERAETDSNEVEANQKRTELSGEEEENEKKKTEFNSKQYLH